MEIEKSLGDILKNALNTSENSTYQEDFWDNADLPVDHNDVVISQEDFLILDYVKTFYLDFYLNVKFAVTNNTRDLLSREINNYIAVKKIFGHNKIDMIKFVRENLNCSLREAKFYVENK